MKIDVLLGLQWGDEGKGKIVDVFTPKYDIIARFQGGPNAGHTIEFEGHKQILHTIPSGIFHENKINVIGNGVVIDPVILLNEIISVKKNNPTPEKNLIISKRAHLITPTHRLLDACYESSKGDAKIGSTLKGISPVYTDKYARIGLRVGDILLPDFKAKYLKLSDVHKKIFNSYNFDYENVLIDKISFPEYEKQWLKAIEYMQTLKIEDTEVYINNALDENKSILAEGAQGSLLDVEFGTYPYVTSSNTLASGVCSGLGVSPHRIGIIFGVFKAYCTRVGNGPFPTEQANEIGEKMQKQGAEFGSTTGRPRRCGWLDLPALKYSVVLNGVDKLIMTKADVLSTFNKILVGTKYLINNKEFDYIPFEFDKYEISPIFNEIEGWNVTLPDNTSKELPIELINYIKLIEKNVGIPITIISTGPDRSQIINLD